MSSDEIARAYDRWAATYDTDRNATRDLDALVLRRAGLDLDDRTVLEIGCGTGKNTVWLAAHARRVIAMDFSAGMLARASAAPSAHGNAVVDFVQHDVRDPWPIESNSVDVVVANLVLEHVESLEPVFSEAARVLRPCGDAFFCELHPERQLRGGQAQLTDTSTDARVLVPAFVHTVAEYESALTKAGLEVIGMGEWTEDGAPPDSPPRLLSIRASKP